MTEGRRPRSSGSSVAEGARPAMGNRVLLVSNDREVAGIWAYALRQTGLDVAQAQSASMALRLWEQEVSDLILIDVSGPDLDGVDLARRLRDSAVCPILLLTTNRDESHSLAAYQAGVDECVVKPISPSLFLAKVRAWLRRSWTVPAGSLNPLEVGAVCLEPDRRTVSTGAGTSIRLTNLEFRLLHLLMSHPGQVLPSDLIIDRVWGFSGGGDSVVLKNVVYRLRRKIEPDPGQPHHLQTVAGEGYVFYAA